MNAHLLWVRIMFSHHHAKLILLPLLLWGLLLPKAYAGGIVANCTESDLTNALSGGGTVTFGCDGTITLSQTLSILSNTVLDGSGRSVRISGNNAVRLFNVSTGVTAHFINLHLVDGRHVGTNGSAGQRGEMGRAGAILNLGGTVVLTSCVLSNNSARGGVGGTLQSSPPGLIGTGGDASGGAIYNAEGTVRATNCWFLASSVLGGTGGTTSSGTVGNAGDSFGGAVFNQSGSVEIANCHFATNTAIGLIAPTTVFGYGIPGSGSGGALFSTGGVVTIENSSFFSNRSEGGELPGNGIRSGNAQGGALSVTNATLICRASVFATNSAKANRNLRFGEPGNGSGGAVFVSGNLTFSDCIFQGNVALNLGGGGRFNVDGAGGDGEGGAIYGMNILRMSGCLLNGNSAQGGNGGPIQSAAGEGGHGIGGALYHVGNGWITNSTFHRNLARGGDGLTGFGNVYNGPGLGGAIYQSTGTLELLHVTLSGNIAVGGTNRFAIQSGLAQGSGLFTTNGSIKLYNSIVAAGVHSTNCFGNIIDGGHNINSDGSGSFTASGSLSNTDPKLSGLDDFGGPTLTMALLAGSPALNSADAAQQSLTDQRGIARPFGSAPDIGAFESSPPYSVRGRITGWPVNLHVRVGTATTNVAANGTYILSGLATGSSVVTPQGPESVFAPNNQTLSLGPDAVNVDFHSYRSNAFTIEHVTNDVSRFVYAAAATETWRVLTETNLSIQNWPPYSTNTTDAGGFFHFFRTNALAPDEHFFRAVKP